MSEVSQTPPESETSADLFEQISDCCLRLTTNLDLDDVVQAVADEARSLTAARYGAFELFDDTGHRERLVTSGVPWPHAKSGCPPAHIPSCPASTILAENLLPH